ncbi:MAG: sulfatase-like hydrolase/transferase [Pseudomonadales bacterium]
MFKSKLFVNLVAGIILPLLIASFSAQAAGPGSKIIYDAEYLLSLDQHRDEWKEQDQQISQKLAEMKKKYGKSPNIIHIMWDDNSLGQVGVPIMNKVLGFDTPRFNQMAEEGISFSRMYSEPSCTPTRTAALTGRLSVRAGMYKVGFPPDGMGLHKDEVTIAEVLSKVGYQTAFIGKAHQGDIEQSYMNNQGFDYANFSMYNQYPFIAWQPGGPVVGLFENQKDKNYEVDKHFGPLGYVNQLEGRKGEKPRVFMGNSRADYKKLLRVNQQQVIDYIDSNAASDKPFYMAYWPHVFDAARKPEELTTSANNWVAESLVDLDRDIGQILDKLRAAGIAENTLVIAMADNGPMHELAPLTQEPIFRGGKGDYLEGGIRVPAFAWWPGVIAADQIVGDIVSVHDLFTTFISLAGGLNKIPTDRVIDGIDQSSLLLNGDGYSRRDYLHIYTGDILAASMKQQIKRKWVGERPGLMGDDFTSVYLDTKEEHLKMAPYLWAWAAFDHMKERHEAMIREYPNRAPTHGKPYEGIVDLPAAAQALADRLPTTYQ